MFNKLMIWLGFRVGIKSVSVTSIPMRDKDTLLRTVAVGTDGKAYELVNISGRQMWRQLPSLKARNIHRVVQFPTNQIPTSQLS